MALRLSINLGFVTNSSSVVHHFPREVLQDPTVRTFMEKFEIMGGFVGTDLWHRGQCATVAITAEQKDQARRDLESINHGRDDDYVTTVPGISRDDSVVVIYGDEYASLAGSLAGLMREAAERLGMKSSDYGESYN